MASQLDVEPTSGIEEAARKAARQRAVERLATELQHPDQLAKVEQIRFKHFNKKISLETQLKNLVSSQLKEASEGTDKLAASLSLLSSTKQNAVKIQELARDTSILIPHYEIVQEVNVTRQNLRITKEKLNIFIQIPNKLAKIHRLMKEDINVLKAYIEVRALEKERDSVLKQALQFPAQQRELRDIFKSVDQVSDDLDDILWRLLEDHFNLALNLPAVLIKVMQVIYRESRVKQEADRAAQRLREIKEAVASGEDESLLITAQQRRTLELQLNAMPKMDYMATACSKLRNAIRKRFFTYFELSRLQDDGSTQRAGYYGNAHDLIGGYDAQLSVNASRKVLVDLEKVIDDVYHCFPESFQIRELYIQSYHEFFFELLTEICKVSGKKENPVGDTLLLFKWVKMFYEPQLRRLAISPRVPELTTALTPLVEEYREYVFNSIDELANRIVAMDRDSPPEILDDGLYTMAPMTLFNIVQTHLDVAINANAAVVSIVTFQEIKKVLMSYQQKFRRFLESDDSNLDVPYLIAQINNFDKCYSNTEEMESRAQKVFENDPVTYAGLLMSEVTNGFQDLVKLSRELLRRHCFSVLDEDLVKIFTKAWYDEEIVEIIIATLNDYFGNEIKGRLLDSYFSKFAIECLDKCVLTYVSQLLYGKGRAPISKRTGERLRYDTNRLSSFFQNWQVRDRFVKTHLQVLYDLSDLIIADYDTINGHIDTLIKNTPDVTQDAMKIILGARDDLDKKQVTSLIDYFNSSYDKYGPNTFPTSGIFYTLRKEHKGDKNK